MALRMTVILLTIMMKCFPTAGQICDCQIGNLPQTIHSKSANDSGFFFNLDNPATCSGKISALLGCYYPPACEQNSTIDFGIWRPLGNGTYYITPNSSFSFHLIQPQESYQFLCQKWSFPGGRAVSVEEGDIIGITSVGAGAETGCHFLRAGLTGFTTCQLAFRKEALSFDRIELTTRVGYGFYVTADVDIGSTDSNSSIAECNIGPSRTSGFSPTPTATHTTTFRAGLSLTPIATDTVVSRGSVLSLWLIFILVVVSCIMLAVTLLLIGILYIRLKRRRSSAVKTRGRRSVQNEATLIRRPTLLGDIPTVSDEDISLDAFDMEISDNRIQQQMVSATIFTNVTAELTDDEQHSYSSTDTSELHVHQAGKNSSAARQSFQFPVDDSTEDVSSPQPRISFSTPPAFRRSLSEGTLSTPATEEPSQHPTYSNTSSSSIISMQQFVHKKSHSFPHLSKEPPSPYGHANTSPGQPRTWEAHDLVSVDSYARRPPFHCSPTDSEAVIPSHGHSRLGTRHTVSPNPDANEGTLIDIAHYEEVGLGNPSSSIQGNEQQPENSPTRNRKHAITTPLYPHPAVGVNRPTYVQQFNEPSLITFPLEGGQNTGASSSRIGYVAAQEPPMTEQGKHIHDNAVPPPPPPPRRQDRKEEGHGHLTQDSAMEDSLRYTPVFV